MPPSPAETPENETNPQTQDQLSLNPWEAAYLRFESPEEEIRKFIEADSLAYLSIGSLRKAVADENHEYCYACYTGDYPTELVNIEQLIGAKKC